jgi:hypothetical protein
LPFLYRHGEADEIGRLRLGQIFQNVLIAFAIQLRDALAKDLNVELHLGVSAEARCSARMSLSVRTCPALTTFML